MSIVVEDTPAVVIKQGQLTLGLLCVLTAAAWCNSPDKLENMKNVSHYPPTSRHDTLQLH